MPSLRGLHVHITDKDGKNLNEVGVRYLRETTDGKKTSAYIESTVRT